MSTIPGAALDYLTSLEWIRAKENRCLVGPASTGQSHLLVALGVAAPPSRTQGPLLHRRRPRRDLYRGLAGSSVGHLNDTLLGNELLLCR